MARTITEIQNNILADIASDSTLAQLTSTSKVAIWRLFVYIASVAIWTLEKLFDLHKTETDDTIAQLKPHTLRWYRNVALAFQYGYALVVDSDRYDNTGIDADLIDASKIIKYAAVVEAKAESRLIVKIATETGGKLQPISQAQHDAFAAYITEVKDAGVNVSVINYRPDKLYLSIVIYYDPLVLDAQGNSILSGGRPVESALEEYMKELPFNGELVLAHLIDKLQQVPGVEIPHLTNAQTSWIDAKTKDYGAVEAIAVKKIPESGYFEIVDYNNITYQPNEQKNI